MKVYAGAVAVDLDGVPVAQGAGTGPLRVYTRGVQVEVINAEPPIEPAAPHYSDGMQPFEVRQLQGDYAPAGALTFRLSQPAPWNAATGWFGARGQIDAWSGGCTDGTRVLFSGGGHEGSDGCNNGVHVFDFAQVDGRPVGFSTLTGSRVDPADIGDKALVYPNQRFANGMPPGQHTYSQMLRSPAGRIVRARGPFHWFDEATGQYTIPTLDTAALGGKALTQSGSTMLMSPDGDLVMLLNANGTPGTLFIDLPSGAIKVVGGFLKNWGSSAAVDAHSCLDTKRNRWIVIGGTASWRTVHFVSVDWAARTMTAQNVTPPEALVNMTNAADLPLCGGMGILYDAALDCFWAFSHKGEAYAGSFKRLVRLDAQTGAIVGMYPLSVPVVTRSTGQYGRCVLLPQQRVIGLVPHFDLPAVIIKLPPAPGGGGSDPKPPEPETPPAPEPAPAPAPEPALPPASGGSDWTARSTGPGVLCAVAFADPRELSAYMRNQSASNPVHIIQTDIGPAMRATIYGARLVEPVPECPSYCSNKTPAGADAARQVWRVSEVSHIPAGPLPYELYVGKGVCTERIRVEAIDRDAGTITVIRRLSGETISVDGVVYPGGAAATAAPAYPGDGSVTMGRDGGMWVRPLAALRTPGLPDDIGITNGSARKARTWPPLGGTAARPHLGWREGYWGHRSYWDGTDAPYRDWTPMQAAGGRHTRSDAFEGDDLWVQFRARLDAARLAVGSTPRKMLFLQNDVAGSGQLFWTAGGGRTKRPGDYRPINRGNELIPCTCYADGAARHGGLLTVPQSGGLGDGTQWQHDYPECRWQGYTDKSATCWRFPADKWVTYMLHLKLGRDNAPQPYTGWSAVANHVGPWPAATDPDYRTTLQVFVAEDGDEDWTTITSSDAFVWMFGDEKYEPGHYDYNPPGLNCLWLGQFGNLYLGSGAVAPPGVPTHADYTQVIVSRGPIPMPRTGLLPG